MKQYCWSWTHSKPVSALDGHFVCCDCLDEETKINQTINELTSVNRAIEFYIEDSKVQRQHPAQAQILESVVADFFTTSHNELKNGQAFRVDISQGAQSQLDIIIDFDSDLWIGKSRRNIVASPPLAHIEVSYRSTFDLKKIKKDFEKVHETVIGGAVLSPPKKIWTAFVALGVGWKDKVDIIRMLLHEHFHDKKSRKIIIPKKGPFWDYPDVLIFPGFIYKKHEFCTEPYGLDSLPVYVEIPSALNDPVYFLRPLAIARGFFNFYLKASNDNRLDTGRAWGDRESSSIMGPNVRNEGVKQSVISLDHAPHKLYERDFSNIESTRFLPFTANSSVCSQNKKYIYERCK